MSEYYLQTINLRGLHFKKFSAGGAWCAPLPLEIPSDASDDAYDSETLVLSYKTAAGADESYSFTEEEITEALESSCPTDN